MRDDTVPFSSLILISLGVLFLGEILGFEIRPWLIIAKYWPLLIIFWDQLVSYFRSVKTPTQPGEACYPAAILSCCFPGGSRKRVTKAVGFNLGTPSGGNLNIGPDEPFCISMNHKKALLTSRRNLSP